MADVRVALDYIEALTLNEPAVRIAAVYTEVIVPATTTVHLASNYIEVLMPLASTEAFEVFIGWGVPTN